MINLGYVALGLGFVGPLEPAQAFEHGLDLFVAVTGDYLEVATRIGRSEFGLESRCLSRELEEHELGERRRGVERDAGRTADLLAGRPTQVTVFASEEIEVERSRRSLGCCREPFQIGGQHRQLLLGPVAPCSRAATPAFSTRQS